MFRKWAEGGTQWYSAFLGWGSPRFYVLYHKKTNKQKLNTYYIGFFFLKHIGDKGQYHKRVIYKIYPVKIFKELREKSKK